MGVGSGRMAGGMIVTLLATYFLFGAMGNRMDKIMTGFVPAYSNRIVMKGESGPSIGGRGCCACHCVYPASAGNCLTSSPSPVCSPTDSRSAHLPPSAPPPPSRPPLACEWLAGRARWGAVTKLGDENSLRSRNACALAVYALTPHASRPARRHRRRARLGRGVEGRARVGTLWHSCGAPLSCALRVGKGPL